MAANKTHETTGKLLQAVLNVQSVSRLYNKPSSYFLQAAARRVGGISEIGDSHQGHETTNKKAERFMTLEAVTRQRLVKMQKNVLY
jgi:hypothetical protein